MQMVILCGGLATRLGDLAKDTPKSMIRIKGKPFLEYQIEILKKQLIKDIVLCVGYLSEKIIDYFGDGKKFGVNIQYSHDDKKPLGPIGAMKNAEPLLNNVFFIMYGDSYLFVDFKKAYSYFLEHDDLALMVAYKNFDKYDASNLVIKNGKIVACGKENKTKDMVYIDYGTSILRKKVLDLVPKDTYYSTVQFFSDLVKRKELLAFVVKKRFYHIGTPEVLEEFNDYIKGLG
jgi:NDP-sugar pyrophosphorylase family protein